MTDDLYTDRQLIWLMLQKKKQERAELDQEIKALKAAHESMIERDSVPDDGTEPPNPMDRIT